MTGWVSAVRPMKASCRATLAKSAGTTRPASCCSLLDSSALGRRPDAEAVFRAAGRHMATESYRTIGVVARRMMRLLPAFMARPLALSHSRRIARRYLRGRISRVGAQVYLEVERSVTLDTAPRSVGCTYYEASLKELLRLLVNSVGAVEHVGCATRGEGTCAWRAEWKPTFAQQE